MARRKWLPTDKELVVWLYLKLGRDNERLTTEIMLKSENGLFGKKGHPTEWERIARERPLEIKHYLEKNNVSLDDYLVFGIDNSFPDEKKLSNTKSLYERKFGKIEWVHEIRDLSKTA